MANPRKRDGTQWETTIVTKAQEHGYKAWRLAEGGTKDPGDVAIETPSGDTYVLECRNRANMNIHQAGDKHAEKVAKADLPFVPAGTAVAWRRRKRKEGNVYRTDVGSPGVWVSVDEYLELIGR